MRDRNDSQVLFFTGLLSCFALQTSLFLSGNLILVFALTLVSGSISLQLHDDTENLDNKRYSARSNPALSLFKIAFALRGIALKMNKVSYFCFNLSLFFGLSLALCHLLFNEYISILVLYFACLASAVAFALMMQKLVNRETV